jgi:AcrR family transcriptional regulator
MARRKLGSDIDERIMDEVMKSAMRQGLCFVSTKRIAAKLKISEPVIFAHFKTKQGLLDASFKRAWMNFLGNEGFAIEEATPLADLYDSFSKLVRTKLRRKKEIVFINYYFASTYYDNEVVLEATKDYRMSLIQILRRYWGGKVSDEDYQIATRMFVDSVVVSLAHLVKGDFPDTDHIRRLLFNRCVYGLHDALELAYAEVASPVERA